ncbi:MAG: hypothetical protein WCD49_09670 [Candidatus Acidiferrales bacterium]
MTAELHMTGDVEEVMRNFKSFVVARNSGTFASVRSLALSVAAVLSILALTGCVTKQAAPSTVPVVTFQLLPPSTIQAGAQVQLVAVVTNDPKMLGIDWNASCVTTSCGSFNPAHTVSGQATTYMAPTTVPQGGVNIAARATASPAQTVVANVSIFTNVQIKLTGFPSSPLGAGNTTTLIAVVTGDPNNPPLGVGWSLNCTAAVCGTLSSLNTASGVPVVYTAPSTVATPFTVTFQATPLADTTQIISASIAVNPASGVSIVITGLPSTIQAGGTANVTATVSNDPMGGGVTWSATCSNSAAAGQCGTFTNPPTTPSGTPITYTAPTTVPTGGVPVTIMATSVDSPAVATAITTITNPTLSVTISQPPPSTLLVGTSTPLVATLQNDTTNKGVTWSASCTPATGSTCGTFTPTATLSGIVTTYAAPNIIPTNAGGVVTITATTVATPVATATATVAIAAAGSVSINWTSSPLTPPSTLLESAEATISATVANDPTTGTNGVTWSVTCTAGAGGDCGSFTTNPTANGLNTMYEAPSVLPLNGGLVTITATAQAAPSPTVSKPVTITAPTLTVTIDTPPTSIEAGTTAQLTATITNDSPTAPNGVNWSVTCTGGTGTNPCGSFSPTNTLTGVATTYSAPTSAPSGGTVTITATSAAQSNVSDSTPPITITANTSAGLLNGHYALNISAQNGFGFIGVVGSIIADGAGNITGGEEDTPPINSCGASSVTGITGTYTVGSDRRGTITLDAGSNCFGASGTQTLAFALAGSGSPATHALITEVDNTVGSGSLDLQTSSTIAGSYAFVWDGEDLINGGNPNTNVSTTDQGGTISVSGSTMTITADMNDQSLQTISQVSGSGNFTTPDSFGRSTLTITSGTLIDNTYVFYVVNAGQMKFLEDDGATYVEIGPVYSQGTSAFSGNYVFTFAGVDGGQSSATNSTVAGGGTLTTTSGTGLTGVLDFNDNGLQTGSGGAAVTGTFTAPTSGRGTLTLTGAPTGVSKFTYYPTANNGNLLLEIDNNFVSIGDVLAQSSTTLALGNYAMNFTNATAGIAYPEVDAVGQVTSDGTATFPSGTVDFFNPAADLFLDAPLTGTFAASAGQGRYDGTLAIMESSSTTATLKEIFYVASPSMVLFIESDAVAQTSGIMLIQ